jgi:predicted RNase H-like nuclease (RuvC/YqgF family)
MSTNIRKFERERNELKELRNHLQKTYDLISKKNKTNRRLELLSLKIKKLNIIIPDMNKAIKILGRNNYSMYDFVRLDPWVLKKLNNY